MKKFGVMFILLWLVMLTVAGCLFREAGPCVGYGCPAFAPMVAQAPQQRAQSAQNRKASTRQVQAQNDRGVAPAAKPGQ